MSRPITFLSDYGVDDEFAGVCRAVMKGIAPDATIVDLTHGVPRHAVAQGAAVLARALPYCAPGIHVAVVDPGVGSDRRAVAVAVADADRILVGPDNGLLAPSAERLGGAREAVDVSLSPFRLEPVSATFHGRDLFAPVAARLAAGATLADAGEPIDPLSLEAAPLPSPRILPSGVLAHVVAVDRFGNATLDVPHELLPDTGLRMGQPVRLETRGATHRAAFTLTFSDVPSGSLLVYENSYRDLAIGVNRGSAADELDLEPGLELTLRPE